MGHDFRRCAGGEIVHNGVAAAVVRLLSPVELGLGRRLSAGIGGEGLSEDCGSRHQRAEEWRVSELARSRGIIALDSLPVLLLQASWR